MTSPLGRKCKRAMHRILSLREGDWREHRRGEICRLRHEDRYLNLYCDVLVSKRKSDGVPRR